MFATTVRRLAGGFVRLVQFKNNVFYKRCFIPCWGAHYTSGAYLISHYFGCTFCRVNDNNFALYTNGASYCGLTYKVTRGYHQRGYRNTSYIFSLGGHSVFQCVTCLVLSCGNVYPTIDDLQCGFVAIGVNARGAGGDATTCGLS